MAGEAQLTSEALDRIAQVIKEQESQSAAGAAAVPNEILAQVGAAPDNRRALSEQLRHAIQASGLTHYRLAQKAGISPSMLDHFVRRERSLHLDSVDKIADALGLTLVTADRDKND
jgi:ribosome-binding protein aMBF1 (putative translation factor)